MAKEELLITIVMLWKEVYNRNGKMTPEIHDFSITGENKFIEEVSSKIHIQYVKVPLKFFDMPRDKQFTYLKKLADVNKIQKFKTDMITEIKNELQRDNSSNDEFDEVKKDINSLNIYISVYEDALTGILLF